ncbi:dehydrogenase [Vibrio sp. qd031]|uniref:zinc-binding dehydrogenase n=1 Tax=Vibrio sp. qd031 TaxID=1603038 RepID=UPI000A11BA18|nr:zinc-binding dehydrogenase [Vibrio sp. qd031]ORT52849.1 dehydrogenase [Vibrio sp. qd031]
MKALTYHLQMDKFYLSELVEPELENDWDVVVKVHAVGLNPVDAKVNFWKALVPDIDNTFVGGLDVSGTVVKVGDKVESWVVGDKVLYHGNMRRTRGGCAEFAVHDARTLTVHPKVSHELAAATPCAGWTAWRALVDKLDIETRDSIYIVGGSGGVGGFAIQIAKYFGVDKIITSCSEKNHDYVRDLGATHVIDYQKQDIVKEIMAITDGNGVEVALDCVGGDNDIIAATALAFEGEMVELVQTVRPSEYPDAFLRGLSFHQLSLGSGHVNDHSGRTGITDAGVQFNQLLENGHIRVPALEVIELEHAANALKDIRNQRTVGKIVVKIE